MPNPKNRGGGDVAPLEGTQTTEGATPPQDGIIPPQDDGNATPPDPGAAGNDTPPQENSQTPPQDDGGDPNAPPPDNEGDKGKQGDGNGNTPPPPPSEGKKRIKNADLKGKNINIGDGNVIAVDENGIFEVDEVQAKRLLTIPGFGEA